MSIAVEIVNQSRVDGIAYWLMKSEPEAYSIDQLKQDKKTIWEGVRNYQARNFMRDNMKQGDMVLFYHSNAKPSAIVGLAYITKIEIVDPSQFDPQSKYFDEKSTIKQPRWFCVELTFKAKFKKQLSLESIKQNYLLDSMLLVQKGMRLSVQPVLKEHFDIICSMEHN